MTITTLILLLATGIVAVTLFNGQQVQNDHLINNCCLLRYGRFTFSRKTKPSGLYVIPNGPYSLLVRASYFISYSVYTRSTSVIFIIYKWRWGCRYFLTSRISMPCSEAIR